PAFRSRGSAEPTEPPRLFLVDARGAQRLRVRLEPLEAHGHAVPARPHVAVFALQLDSARTARGPVAPEDDHLVVAGVDVAVHVDFEVGIRLANRPEPGAPDPGAGLDRVPRVHVLDVLGDQSPHGLLAVPALVDLADQLDVLLGHLPPGYETAGDVASRMDARSPAAAAMVERVAT